MKTLFAALRLLLCLTVLTGIAYPLTVTLVANLFFAHAAGGSLISRAGTSAPVGSTLIAQEFKSARYFQSRPSAVGYNPLPSGGSNLGPTSADLKKSFDERHAKLIAENPEAGEPPQELLFASASGVDPHVSPEAAHYQAARVATARGLDRKDVDTLIESTTEGRQFGILGEPRVNVLRLNLALDARERSSSP